MQMVSGIIGDTSATYTLLCRPDQLVFEGARINFEYAPGLPLARIRRTAMLKRRAQSPPLKSTDLPCLALPRGLCPRTLSALVVIFGAEAWVERFASVLRNLGYPPLCLL